MATLRVPRTREVDVESIALRSVTNWRYPLGNDAFCEHLLSVVHDWEFVPRELVSYVLVLIAAVEANLARNGVELDGRRVYGPDDLPDMRQLPGSDVEFIGYQSLTHCRVGQLRDDCNDNLSMDAFFRLAAAACDEVAAQAVMGALCLKANTSLELEDGLLYGIVKVIVDRWLDARWDYPVSWIANTEYVTSGEPSPRLVYDLSRNAVERAWERQRVAMTHDWYIEDCFVQLPCVVTSDKPDPNGDETESDGDCVEGPTG